ncbi:hypothetical protein MSG28_005700 [Choristoneura fumiferana]|uniref:Uncharacterized protein n=1 Tax=Choristoneura fumiferana TaxID=7141 RepID=A0ACC0KZP3_CHOFU|nr:hypothetical protein MSG28_005700 [Choristoneura fumiferana]
MCILFMYCGDNDAGSDYRLVLAENRDEYYDRLASNMAVWEDPTVIAGRDLGASDGDGTWLAVSPQRRKLGVLLNLPGNKKADAKSRGRIVTDYVQCESSTEDYLKTKQSLLKEVNEFVLLTVEFGKETKVQSYTNATDNLTSWNEPCLGFSNSLPEKPLKKAEAGKASLKEICSKYPKVGSKDKLIEELIGLLKSKEVHLPDEQLENRSPLYQEFSSIFVTIPQGRYGTRTHTIMLLTKTGHLDLIEISLQDPVDLANQNWKRTEYQTDI